ncbi:hypothetical protein ACLMAJ_29685 [Nocardia sp. KC 131]|uniref:hypothetical protein n=1 Tax=Nocardia arseniciresistens TaxID=3392119 RepID=UPI00398E77EC
MDRDTDDWVITVADQNNAGTEVASFLWVESSSVSRISQQDTVPGYQLSPSISSSNVGGYNASSQISLSLG